MKILIPFSIHQFYTKKIRSLQRAFRTDSSPDIVNGVNDPIIQILRSFQLVIDNKRFSKDPFYGFHSEDVHAVRHSMVC